MRGRKGASTLAPPAVVCATLAIDVVAEDVQDTCGCPLHVYALDCGEGRQAAEAALVFGSVRKTRTTGFSQ